MNVGLEPADQPREIAPGEVGAEPRQGVVGGLEQLRRRQRAQRIGREIAVRPVVPVDVLQAPLGVVGRGEPEELAHGVVPGAGQIPEREIAGDHRLLQPVAQNHVQGIGHLIGVDADHPGFHQDAEAIDVVGLPRRAAAPEGVADHRRGEGQEFPAAAGLHLDQQRLAFVQTHAARPAHRLVTPATRQALLVKGVAGLVQRRHHRRHEIRLVIARGDAHVLGHAAAEGMVRDVETPARKIEAQRLHQLHAKLFLGAGIERPFEGEGRRLPRLMGEDAFEKVRQESGQIVEHRIDIGAPGAGFVSIQQGVVIAQPKFLAPGPGHLAHKRQQLFRRGDDGSEVVLLPRRPPRHLRGRRRPRQGGDEIGADGVGVAPDAAHLAQVGALPGIETVGIGSLRQQRRQARIDEDLMGDDVEGGELTGAGLGAARRHHRRGVPVQHGGDIAELRVPGEAPLELFISAHGPVEFRR